MKNTIVIVLVLLGLYWLLDHYAPWPLSHESLGLYAHTAHKIIGVILLIAAVLVAMLWKRKPKAPEMSSMSQMPQNPAMPQNSGTTPNTNM